MIEPRMATMLGYLTTDAAVDPALLLPRPVRRVPLHVQRHHGRRRAIDQRLRVRARQWRERRRHRRGPVSARCSRASARSRTSSRWASCAAAKARPSWSRSRVTGAASEADAWMAARAIANSPLVKTAVHGGDPNWGRLVAAAGRSGARLRPRPGAGARSARWCSSRTGAPFDERAAPTAAEYLEGTSLEITVDLGTGGAASAPPSGRATSPRST